jgi:TfoX/Sxy family transcriptional regulator of competence genes
MKFGLLEKLLNSMMIQKQSDSGIKKSFTKLKNYTKKLPLVMAYNQNLANRVREKFVKLPNVVEKEMMGGLTFMYNDKMCVGIIKDELMCRIDPNLHDIAVEKIGCKTMDFTKRPMKGYIMIDGNGMKTQKDFDYWIDLALDFNKNAKSSKRTKK